MGICSDAHITGKYYVSNDAFNALVGTHPYINGGESVKSKKFQTDLSSVSLFLYRELFFGTVKVE